MAAIEMTKKNSKLPPVGQLDNVTPATRLLEKRRLLYEKQEAYEQKKKEYRQNELEYREKEKLLKSKDQDIQQSMIQFASYLDTNQKTMKKCDDNIEELRQEIEEKDREIAKKERLYAIIMGKCNRINEQKDAVEQYHKYLEMVKKENDDYAEISDITDRHKTLQLQQQNLQETLNKKEVELIECRKTVDDYEKNKQSEIIMLGRTTGDLGKEFEKVDQERYQMRNQSEEIASKKLTKDKELSMVLMAIDNLERMCAVRKQKNPNGLYYDAILTHKHLEKIKKLLENFDHEEERCELAKYQLISIGQYLHDFRKMIKEYDAQNNPTKKKVKSTSLMNTMKEATTSTSKKGGDGHYGDENVNSVNQQVSMSGHGGHTVNVGAGQHTNQDQSNSHVLD